MVDMERCQKYSGPMALNKLNLSMLSNLTLFHNFPEPILEAGYSIYTNGTALGPRVG